MPMGNIKCSRLSLYSNYNPKTTLNITGYSNENKALQRIKLIT